MRVAWFSPWPPQESGVAGRSAELVPELCRRGMGIDVFVDHHAIEVPRIPGADAPRPGTHQLLSAHDFVWRYRRGHYDLVVYQLGNSRLHEYIWPYLFRWPGLAVLHDARLHHARGRARLRRGEFDAYREEFAFNHPELGPDIAELGVAGFAGHYYFLWPMQRAVVSASRIVATHARGAVDEILRGIPDSERRPVEYIALGEGTAVPIDDAARVARRKALGFVDQDLVFGVFGGIGPEKRFGPILRCLARLRRRLPQAKLLIVGRLAAGFDIAADVMAVGLGDAVRFAEALTDAEFDELIGAGDISLNLRWPTALETSGPWLRALAAGKPTVTIALAHQAHVPALDPRTWVSWPGTPMVPPVTVAVDILDEEHSLGLAMARLTEDDELRSALGKAARQYWEREHTLARMTDDYERVMALAQATPDPVVVLPAAFRPDPMRQTRRTLEQFAVSSCEFC